MTLFIIGFAIGIFAGTFIANKPFKVRVIKECKRFYGELEKLAGISTKKQAKAKKEAK